MEKRLSRAIQLRNDNMLEEAKSLFLEMVSEDPENALVQYHTAWLHDKMGEEHSAIPYYERALALGLGGEDLRGALLGLGSTYRTIGEYEKSVLILRRGLREIPDAKEFPVFLSMALYNIGESKEAVSLLLKTLAEVGSDEGIQRFKRAILLYAEDLDRTWE